MSRVAEALEKSRRGGGEEDTPPSPATIDSPWDLDDRPAPPRQVLSRPAIPIDQAALPRTAPRKVDPPSRAADRIGQRAVDELTHLIQRVFQPGTAEPSVRAVLFAPIGSTGDSAALCARAADALASHTPLSTCAVDADLRTAGLHGAFGLSDGRGLSDALATGNRTLPIETFTTRVRANLWAMPAGTRCAEALPHLAPEALRAVVTDLLQRFDYVLISGPSGGGSDAAALGAAVHGVVLVLQANATRREAARRIADDLRAANVQILGAVLGNRTFPIPEAIYQKL